MAHTHTVLLYHVVFSTKARLPCLTPQARELLFPYMSGIIANHGGSALLINGVADHVHILCQLRSQPDIATIVQAIKGGASSWYNREAKASPVLHWQEGYGAFTVSPSQKETVLHYIANQEAHHRRRTFAEEYEEMLVKSGVEFDKRFFLD
ncbi:MAG: REP-associated tyrosine transposase [Candidatus Sumerlaeota bacterium]|nr:REP-associated tyrosine transposase [Candidatus Sumerlaeota bacterium]